MSPVAPRYHAPLTGIRAIAAAMVVVFHCNGLFPTDIMSVFPFLDRGYFGVDLFFILSGFIITHVYFSIIRQPNRKSVRIFLWHRFVRIYPVHITVLLGLILMITLARLAGQDIGQPELWRPQSIPWHMTLMQVLSASAAGSWNIPAWSISAEWFAYMTFPLIAPALARVKSFSAAIVLAVICLGIIAVLFSLFDVIMVGAIDGWSALVRVVFEFACGACLCRAAILTDYRPSGINGDVIGVIGAALFLCVASFGVSNALILLSLALIIFGAALAHGRFASFLGTPLMVWLGELSFSVYMVHYPVLNVVRKFVFRFDYLALPQYQRYFVWLLAFAAVMAAAAAMYYVVERPVRTRLRNFAGVFDREKAQPATRFGSPATSDSRVK